MGKIETENLYFEFGVFYKSTSKFFADLTVISKMKP